MIVPCWITKSDVKTDLLFSHVIKASDNWNKKIWTWSWIISNPDLTGVPDHILKETSVGVTHALFRS